MPSSRSFRPRKSRQSQGIQITMRYMSLRASTKRMARYSFRRICVRTLTCRACSLIFPPQVRWAVRCGLSGSLSSARIHLNNLPFTITRRHAGLGKELLARKELLALNGGLPRENRSLNQIQRALRERFSSSRIRIRSRRAPERR